MKRFHAFCNAFNITSPFPLTELLLCYYASYLADQGLAPQTIKSYLSALRDAQINLGLPDPRDHSSLPLLKRIQAGISRVRLQSKNQTGQRVRFPITPPILRQLKDRLSSSSDPNRVVVWAVASSAFFGFFRLGELLPEKASMFNPGTDLAWGDVALDSHTNPRTVQFHIKKSKCDQFGKGADIVMGATDDSLCPVQAITSYVTMRGSNPGPFFQNAAGATVTKPWFVKEIRARLAECGLHQSDFAGQSFRIGAATTAAMAGVEDSTIQILGRWHSAAFLRYVRVPKGRLASLSSTLAKQFPSPS